jgi:NAD+ synthase
MARIRMIILFDLAKKNHALVCGTENRSENLLGYFTRFGDQASDLEPIGHLYKTQVYELAEYLKVPKDIIEQKPTAGLWKNQTDEKEFGFSYKEADPVLHHYFDKKMGVDRIKKLGFANAEKIIHCPE